MLEFLLALLTTATVAALLVPLLRPRLAATDRLDKRHRRLSRPARRGRARARGGHAVPLRRRRRPHRDRAPPARRRRARSCAGGASLRWRVMAPLPHTRALPRHPPVRPRPLSPDRPARPPRRPLHRPPRTPLRHPTAPRPTLAETIAAARARLAAAPDDPDALSALGEALTYEADGVVTPPAQDAFRRALDRNPDDPRAMFYLGLHEAQSGDAGPRSSAGGRWSSARPRRPGCRRCAPRSGRARRGRCPAHEPDRGRRPRRPTARCGPPRACPARPRTRCRRCRA